MKKFIALLLALLLSLSLIGCGILGNSDDSGSSEESIEDKVESMVRAEISTKIILNYETQGSPNITYYIQETGDGTYSVSGKVTVRDKYGDSYSGNYDAIATYDSESDKVDVDLDLGSLYKD